MDEKSLEQRIDETITNICKWINEAIENEVIDEVVPEMIKALAELVSARAL